MFSDKRIGILLLITHLLACFSVGIIFRFYKEKPQKNIAFSGKKNETIVKETLNFNNIGDILRNSIKNSINNILIIGGFILIASVLLSIFENLNIVDVIVCLVENLFKMLHIPITLAKGTVYGIIEVTNGLNTLTSTVLKDYTFKIILASFLLGFGGFTVLLQVLSFTSKTDISIKPYFFGKLLHGFIASIYTYIILNCTDLFNLTIPTFSSTIYELAKNSNDSTLSFNWLIYSIIFVVILFLIASLLKGSKSSPTIRKTNISTTKEHSNRVKIRIK